MLFLSYITKSRTRGQWVTKEGISGLRLPMAINSGERGDLLATFRGA